MKALKRAKWSYVLYSCLLSLLGLVLIIWPETSAETFCLMIGAISLGYGIVKIVEYFARGITTYSFFPFDLAGGIFLAIIGGVLFLHPWYVLTFLPIVVGFYMIVDGVMKIQVSMEAKHFGLRAWWVILVGGLLCVVLGIYFFFNPFKGGAILMIVIGIAMLFDGLQNMFSAFYTAKMIKKIRNALEATVDVTDDMRR